MKVAIMQPYFLPYIGYFQLISSADMFIVYDNIKYTKKGWINRNRFLQNGGPAVFSLPLKSDSDSLDVRERVIAKEFNKSKLLNQLNESYKKAPYFKQAFPIIEALIMQDQFNLFSYIHHSLIEICAYLEIKTKILVSSDVMIDHSLKNQEKVLAFCKKLAADVYINAINGQELYKKEDFSNQGIALKFIKTNEIEYKQYNNDFVPYLSILDVMMFNAKEEIQEYLRSGYDLL